jgi:hypothetical protein
MNFSLTPDQERILAVWPELSEGMRFNLLALASASLLRNGKVKAGMLTMGSALRYKAVVGLRHTRQDLGMLARNVAGFLSR